MIVKPYRCGQRWAGSRIDTALHIEDRLATSLVRNRYREMRRQGVPAYLARAAVNELLVAGINSKIVTTVRA